MSKTNREYRNMTIAVAEHRAEGDEEKMIVEGYATTFNEPYVLYSDEFRTISEQVAPGAFDDCDMSDVIMQYNHEGRVFARNRNETLSVNPDEKGLFIEADLSGTEIGRELYTEIRGGYTDRMSFGFTVAKEQWDEEIGEDKRRYILRTIKSIGKLYDVSAVSIPANDGTTISATERSIRSLTDGVIERLDAERRQYDLELRRRRTETKARLLAERN